MKKCELKRMLPGAMFCRLITCDHIYMRDWYKREGIGGYPDILAVYDVFTRCTYYEPVETKSTSLECA